MREQKRARFAVNPYQDVGHGSEGVDGLGGPPHVPRMRPRWRKRYFVLSVLSAVASQAPPVVGPLLPGRAGDVVSSFGPAGLLLLAFMVGIMGSVVLSAVGALLWLRGGRRDYWDVDLGVASACNAYPLAYVGLHAFLGIQW